MQERGYYVPPELQQRLNGTGGKAPVPVSQPEELF
jgi:fused penicillin-binding protein 1a: murein transglycosylase/murein transpeptidase